MADLRCLGPGLHQTVGFQMREGPVHTRAVDRTEAERGEILHEAVTVVGTLGEQQKDRGEEETARRRELELGMPVLGTRDARLLVHARPPPRVTTRTADLQPA